MSSVDDVQIPANPPRDLLRIGFVALPSAAAAAPRYALNHMRAAGAQDVQTAMAIAS
jgi:hypothetical protein